ncbi:MAG: hypothetical protein IKI93_07795 [Clostridia bacterium]|nr:hypothetical protein [Clostridia bacterium]
MDLITYNSINEYFATNNKGILTQVEKDYILRKFSDSYYEALEKYKSSNGSEADATQRQIIVSSLLSESNMNSYIDSAKTYYADLKNGIELELNK